MGEAIAGGMISCSGILPENITVTARTRASLDRIAAKYPGISVSSDNAASARSADLTVVAVKPWQTEAVAKEIGPVLDYGHCTVASVAAGVSFKRLMRPYMISAALISIMTFFLGAYVIPKGTVVRQNFEILYKNRKKNTAAENVQLQVGKGVIAYIQHYDNNRKKGYGFCLDKFEDKKLVSHMTASEIQYDTISDSKYHWKARNWRIRQLKGMRETITSGSVKDTTIMMEPADLVYSKGQQETFTSPQLRDYINKQIDRGSGNVVQYEVEYHKRIATSFASFILTTIGLSLSSRKRKGGMGLYLGIGLALSFTYIMLQTVSSTFAINADTPPMLAAWIPNIIFTVVAYFCYRKAPN